MSDDSDPNGPRGTPPAAVHIKLQLEDPIAQGMYCNLVLVAASETEFVLDFIYLQPQEPKGKVRARVLLAPKHAKLLLARLKQRVEQFEDRYGEIPLPPILPAPPHTETIN